MLMRALDRDELVADASAALSVARTEAGERGVAFLGLSMGGRIAVPGRLRQPPRRGGGCRVCGAARP